LNNKRLLTALKRHKLSYTDFIEVKRKRLQLRNTFYQITTYLICTVSDYSVIHNYARCTYIYLGTEQLNMIDFLFFQSLENLVIVILIKVYTSHQVLFNIVGESNSKLLITSIEVKLSRMADLDEIL